MESFAKVLLILTLTVLLGALSLDVKGAGRPLEAQNEVDKPHDPFENFTPVAPSPGSFGISVPIIPVIGPGLGCGFGPRVGCGIGLGLICRPPNICGPGGVPGLVGAPSPSMSDSP